MCLVTRWAKTSTRATRTAPFFAPRPRRCGAGVVADERTQRRSEAASAKRAESRISAVGVAGFEPATAGTQSRPSTRLRYTPKQREPPYTRGARRWHAERGGFGGG